MQTLAKLKYCLWLLAVLSSIVFSQAGNAATEAKWWLDIKNDRASSVQQMLSIGANPNALSPDGQPAIMQAIRDQAWKVYDVLLRAKRTDVNAVNVSQETPLMYLSVIGDTDRAKQLIQRGAQVNRLGWTPLHYAASKGHIATAQMLIANKAIINAPAADGTTPLMMAALSGNAKLVQLLLDAGADATTLNLNKKDAADWARLTNNTDLANKLDVLTQKILAQRAAVRHGDATAGAASVTAPSINLEDTKTAGTASEPAASSSTSRYFDLDRFDEDESTP